MRGNLLIIFVLFSQLSVAQSFRKRLELGGTLGMTHYLGDINGNSFLKTNMGALSDVQYNQLGICIGGSLRFQFARVLAIRNNLAFAQARGADNQAPRAGNRLRNLSFTTNIFDFSTTLEFPIVFQSSAVSRYVRSRRGRNEGRFYGFIGIGAIYFIPTAEYKGATYSLQPLATEGVDYSRFSLTIPAGVGYAYSWRRKYRLAVEFGFRKTFTDYIDDIHEKYISPAELRANNPADGDIAVALANRFNEGGDPKAEGYGNYYPGEKRGNPKTTDYLIFTTVNYYYTISAKRRSHRAKF